MKTLHLLFATILFVAVALASKPVAVLGPGAGPAHFREPYRERTNRVLSADTVYQLTGWYFIDSTYSLTIPAGTLFLCDSASASSLIISRGAKIYATGTKYRPIIFTTDKPQGTRVPGDWGGVIILGGAPINQPYTTQIEGGFASIPGATAMYGGPDSLDNSGVFEYVRIEFPGYVFVVNSEINGLTLGGVGANTTIDHVQVSYSNDDDYEWFGGTARCKYLVTWRELDDTYDTDFGFSGRLQFCLAKRDPLIFDAINSPAASNGFESDNEGNSPFDHYPRTRARVSNITEIGPQYDTTVAVDATWGRLAMLRRATQFSIYNTVLVGWPLGITLRDTLTQRAAANDWLQIHNTSIQSVGANLLTLTSSPSTGNITGFDMKKWFDGTTPYNPTGNIGSTPRQPMDVGFRPEAWHLDWTYNPVPLPTSELATAGTSYQGNIAGDAWFDSVSYRGAMDPSKARDQQWDWGWTNYDPQHYDGAVPVSGVPYAVADGWNLLSLPIKGSMNTSTAFPGAASSAFTYSGGYNPVSSVSNGKGFWMKFSGAQSFATIVGVTDLIDTFNVTNKWNIIGSLTAPVPTSAITTNPGTGLVASNYYGYNNGYYTATTLEPGKGYWVKANGNGQLYLDESNSALKQAAPSAVSIDNLNRITITDAKAGKQTLYFTEASLDKSVLENYELPPVPPAKCFDARFTTQRYVETGSEVKVLLQGTYPMVVTISASNAYVVNEIQDGKVVASHTISGNTDLTINDSKTSELVITSNGTSGLPKEYSLEQNFPNPFNPTTVINYSLPATSVVKLSVFNALGQEVATLVNGVQEAGFKSVTLDAGSMSSGMYFYKLTAGQFSETKKMVIMK